MTDEAERLKSLSKELLQRYLSACQCPAGIALQPAGWCLTDDFLPLFQMSLLSFDKGCMDRNADCCNQLYTCRKFGKHQSRNSGENNGGEVKIRTFALFSPAFLDWTDVYQTFGKYRAGCGCGLYDNVGLLIATARSRDVPTVTDLWRVLAKIDTPRLRSVRWRSTTDGRIATCIVALIPPLIPLRLVKIS